MTVYSTEPFKLKVMASKNKSLKDIFLTSWPIEATKVISRNKIIELELHYVNCIYTSFIRSYLAVSYKGDKCLEYIIQSFNDFTKSQHSTNKYGNTLIKFYAL